MPMAWEIVFQHVRENYEKLVTNLFTTFRIIMNSISK
jgi:hypothetical protein